MPTPPPRFDRVGFGLTAIPLAALVLVIGLMPQWTADAVSVASSGVTTLFGPAWQVLVVLYSLVALGLAISPWGAARLGGVRRPEYSWPAWIAMLLCTLLAGGGVFWSAAEPVSHFLHPSPTFSHLQGGTAAAFAPALAQAHLHWGLLAWSLVGTLGAIVISAAIVHRGAPPRPRALLPGALSRSASLGTVVDAASVIAVVAGTVGPIGFLAVQLGYALEVLFGVPDALGSRLLILVALVALYTLSAASGIDRGIAWLSRLNVGLALALGLALLVVGPTWALLLGFGESIAVYVTHFPALITDRADHAWLDGWTLFYWGWFFGYAPLMAIFTARISRGRTVRELVVAVSVIAPLLTHLWFSLLGGAAIAVELADPGSIGGPLETAGLGAALIAALQALPFAAVLVPATGVLVFCFLATTGDSMAYTIASVQAQREDPPVWLRAGWGVLMGALAAALLALGDGGIDVLQRFIIITAVPASLLLVPTLVTGPLAARALLQAPPLRSPAEPEPNPSPETP